MDVRTESVALTAELFWYLHTLFVFGDAAVRAQNALFRNCALIFGHMFRHMGKTRDLLMQVRSPLPGSWIQSAIDRSMLSLSRSCLLWTVTLSLPTIT